MRLGAGRTRRRARWGRGSTVLVATVLVLASGCSGDPSDEAAKPSPTPTGAAGGAASGVGEPVRPRVFLRRLQAGFEATTTARLSLATVGDFELAADGDADFGADPTEMALTMNLDGQEQALRWILADGFVYTRLSGVTGGKFAKYSLDDPTNPLGGGLARVLDPETAFGQFAPGLETVTFVGDEDLDGEAAGHYRLGVDSDELAPGVRENMPQVVELDLWLDARDRLRRLTFDLLGTEATVTLADHGDPVAIRAPRRDQILRSV